MHRDVDPGPNSPPSAVGAGRSVIAVIGINRYVAWPVLSNAVNDARAAARMFGRLGFVEVTAPLIDEAATHAPCTDSSPVTWRGWPRTTASCCSSPDTGTHAWQRSAVLR